MFKFDKLYLWTQQQQQFQLRSNEHLLHLYYSECFAEPASKPTGFYAGCFTDVSRNPRPFFCGRMVLSFTPDSCAGLLFALSWVVLIKLCCRSSERRLMDAQEVWQLWEDAGQSGPAAICSLSFTALLMEKQTKQHGSEPCRQTDTHIHTHTPQLHAAKHKTSLYVTEMRARLLSLYSPLLDACVRVCWWVCICVSAFFLPFSEIKLGVSHGCEI